MLTEEEINQIRHLLNFPIEELELNSFLRDRIAYVQEFDDKNGTNIIGKIGEWLVEIENLDQAIASYETEFASGEYKRVELKNEYNVEFYEQGRSAKELRMNRSNAIACIVRDLGLRVNTNVRRVVK